MTDRETMAVYAKAARQYAAGFARSDDNFHEQDVATFAEHLSPGARVLDLGCGPGHWAARFRALGFEVVAMDASPEMAALAKTDFDVDVIVAPFETLCETAEFNGIWANFSLLHAPRCEFADHLARIHKALKPGGIFHIGMKLGTDDGRDSLGRFYAYYSEGELKDYLESAGFCVTRTRRGNGKGLAGGLETYVILTAHA